MSNTPPDKAVEQRRKVLKGALAASGVVTMGYSGPALASFQCVTSTPATGVFGFKKAIDASSNWAWLRLQVFDTNKNNTNTSNGNGNGDTYWKAVKIPNDNKPTSADTTTYFFQDNLGNSPPLLREGDAALPSGIQIQGAGLADQYVHVIIYFDVEGSILGFFPTRTQQTGRDYPAQGSCLTSLNPHMTQTNIRYGG